MIEIALAAQVLVALVVLVLFLASSQASIFHPAASYLAFHWVVFVVRPLLVHFFGFDSIWRYMVFMPAEEDLIRTLAITSEALVVFVGVSLWAGNCVMDQAPKPPPAVTPLLRRALICATILLLPLILYSAYSTRGGPENAGVRAGNGVFIMTNSTGYINDAQFMVAPLLCGWLVVTRFHWANLIPISIYLGYRSWVGWSRWTILLFFFTVVIAFCWHRRLRWLPAWSLVLVLPVLLLFNTLGHNRDLIRNYLKGKPLEVLTYQEAAMSPAARAKMRWDSQDFANFDYLAAVVAIVPRRTETHTYGLQYLQLFTEPIPRILWPGKPAGAPVQLFDLGRYANFVGLTFSLPGDGWMSGGWIGVLITLALAGLITGRAHRAFWRNYAHPIKALFYITFLAITPNWFRDGGISVFKFLLFTWLPLLIWLLFAWILGGRVVPSRGIFFRPTDKLRVLPAAPQQP